MPTDEVAPRTISEMNDPRTVSPEERERTVRLGRQIFKNLIQQYLSPDQLHDLQQCLTAIRQEAAPRPAPQPREVLAETIARTDRKPEQPKIEQVAETKEDNAEYFEACLKTFRG